ncbi:MAG: aminopeptidase [Thermoprotei archaeon]|nr:MAG: aminopeptidase [Thermoprotei archaeon]
MKIGPAPSHVIKSRIKKLQRVMIEANAKSLLITQPENVQYVTGFNVVGNPPKNVWALVLEDREEAYLLVPPLEYYEALDEVKSAEIIQLNRKRRSIEAIIDFLISIKVPIPLYVDDLYPQDLIDAIRRKLELHEVKALGQEIENLRAKKDDYEISCIREAIEKTKRGLEKAHEVLCEGVRETSIAAEIERALREEDVEAMAFDIVVASGPRSSYPHAKPTSKRIKRGENVVIDLGVRVQGYCSDLTRTFIVGRNPEVEEKLSHVIAAQEEAIIHMKSGIKASVIDEKARGYLKGKALDEHFLHGLGHGLGLSVHEKPTLSDLSEDILEKGNVITVEPGIYFRGRFGVRHEDVVLINDGGCIKLS